MSSLSVCPLSALEKTLAETGARSMISFAGPGKGIAKPSQISAGFLSLEFNDISEARKGLIEPNAEHIGAICEFVARWDGEKPMVLQCWMGISRSTAAALIVKALLDPLQDMNKLAQSLRNSSPTSTPNPLMISLADERMKLDGALVNGVKAIGRGAEAFEGTPFSIGIDS